MAEIGVDTPQKMNELVYRQLKHFLHGAISRFKFEDGGYSPHIELANQSGTNEASIDLGFKVLSNSQPKSLDLSLKVMPTEGKSSRYSLQEATITLRCVEAVEARVLGELVPNDHGSLIFKGLGVEFTYEFILDEGAGRAVTIPAKPPPVLRAEAFPPRALDTPAVIADGSLKTEEVMAGAATKN